MAINHKWLINRMDVWKELEGHADIVCNIIYAVETTDDDFPENKMTQHGAVAVPFNPKNPVIPYAEVTEEIAIEWVKAELKEYEKDETGMFVLDKKGQRIQIGDFIPQIYADGERQLKELINPPIVTKDLPWQPEV